MEKQVLGQDYNIHYIRKGWGRKVLLSFHGYGLSATSWYLFDAHPEEEYSIIHIQLPFHSGSVISAEQAGKFYGIVLSLLDKEKLNSPFAIMAYSLGANYALHLLEKIPDKISKVLLLAPDGFHAWDFKGFLSTNFFGKYLSKLFIRNPVITRAVLNLSSLTGLSNKKTIAYFLESIENRVKRQSLIDRWAAVAAMNVKPVIALNNAEKYGIDLLIVLGVRDNIIRSKKFKDLRGASIKVNIEDVGHNMMITKMKPIVNSWIKSIPLPQNNE